MIGKLIKCLFLVFLSFSIMPIVNGSPNDPETSQTKIGKPMIDPAFIETTTRAVGGAILGSSIVHVGDTWGALSFANRHSSFSYKDLFQSYYKSYKPIGLYVAPSRGVSIAFYTQIAPVFSEYLTPLSGKLLGAASSGLMLTALTVIPEFTKTTRQLGHEKTSITDLIYGYKKSFVPLSYRVIPTVSCMLVGTDLIRQIMPFSNMTLSTATASIMAAILSQTFATPAENLRIHSIQNPQSKHSFLSKIYELWQQKTLFKGFWARGLSLGFQAAFTLSAAYYSE